MDPQTETPQAGTKGAKPLTWVVGIIVLALMGAAAYVFLSSDRLSSLTSGEAVLASVNGIDIKESDVTTRIGHARTGLEAQGLDLNDPQTRALLESQALDELINETVVLEDAERKGVSVTQEEVDTQFGEIRARFATEVEFDAELSKNDFTQETLRENIRRELTIQKYVAGIETSTTLTVTQAEIQAFYDELKGQTPNLPALVDLQVEIESQLKNQKLAQAVQQIVDGLRGEADITVHQEETTVPETIPAE